MVKQGEANEVVPLYCFDPNHFGTTPYGNMKTGNYRAQFLLEAVLDLKKNLRSIGSDLLIHLGKPADALAGLLPAEGKTTILSQTEVASEEMRVEREVRRATKGKAQMIQLWGHTLYHPSDLPFAATMGDLPDVFTPFRNKVESRCQPRQLVPAPTTGALPLPPDLDAQRLEYAPSRVEDLNVIVPEGAQPLATPQLPAQAVLQFKGGETAALARLKYYLWDSDLLATYFDTRNGMLGGDYSTKFSPWLAHGCLSPRTIYHEIRKYEAQRTQNKSTYWVIFELIWRDFFRFFTVKHGDRIFHEYGTSGKRVRWQDNRELFLRWREGRTGMPLVDANMRELNATGFMSNRGRQNVASYLALDLGCDWRLGADWFESVLQDYDVCSNWGNWVSAAGMTGSRINHFNITKQSKDYDLQGAYIRTWVPELKNVPALRIHEPWLMSKAEQEQAGVRIGADYLAPIPRSAFASPHAGTEEVRGGGRGGGFRGGRGGRGRGGRGQGPLDAGPSGRRQRRSGPKGDFERFG
ncbi:hypothetical protein WJX72_007553 [[Myrmecia] bisecta]|uniref:Cryptochrome DASH n=1 Tax=[Myrmecia] bisecta TaxID=41462 RepID=A0AAW1Q4B0_9CHLO